MKVYSRHDPLAPPDAVRIGRGRGESFGNPYSHLERSNASVKCVTKQQAVDSYEILVASQPSLRQEIRRKLRGRDLICCGRPPCHAYTLLRIANER